MAAKVNVGLSQKAGDGNFGSRGGNVSVEVEVDCSIVAEPAKLQARIRELFALVRASLTEELSGGNSQPAADNGTAHTGNNGSSGGQQPAVPRPVTQSQLKALHGIARTRQLDLAKLVRDRFQLARPEDLSVRQASDLIGAMAQKKE